MNQKKKKRNGLARGTKMMIGPNLGAEAALN